MKNKYLVALFIIGLVMIAAVLLVFNKKESGNSAMTVESPTPRSATICEGETALPSPTYEKEAYDKYTQCKEISVFLKDGTKDESAIALTDEIKKMNGVKSAEYISQEKALEIYKERNKNEPLLLESATKEFFPPTIVVKISDPAKKEEIIKFAQSNVIVDKVIK